MFPLITISAKPSSLIFIDSTIPEISCHSHLNLNFMPKITLCKHSMLGISKLGKPLENCSICSKEAILAIWEINSVSFIGSRGSWFVI